MHSHAFVTSKFDRNELETLVAPGVSVNTICVFLSISVNTPIVASYVVLYLLLTAETLRFTSLFINEDFPAFGAPRKHAFSALAPCGES